MFSKLVKNNLMNEAGLLMGIIILIIFNTINYLKYIIMGITEGFHLLNFFLSVILCFNLINFLIFFETISKRNRMNRQEKLNCFSIILIRGLGWTLFFGTFNYILMGHFLVGIACLIFGIYNLKYSYKLVNKSDDVKVYYKAIITTCLTLISAILLYFIRISDLSLLLNIGLFSVVVLIQFYYIKKRF